MKKIFIDTNVFIRFLVNDNKKMSQEAMKLFERIEGGKIKAETDLIVITEIVWVLSSFYKIKRQDIFEYISLLLQIKNLIIKNEEIIFEALDLYRNKSIDFIDAFCASFAMRRKIKLLCSYDKDFDKIDGIKRVEPKELVS